MKRVILTFLLAMLWFIEPAVGQKGEIDRETQEFAKDFINADTVAIVDVNLSTLDLDKVTEHLIRLANLIDSESDAAKGAIASATSRLEELKKLGVTKQTMIFAPIDLKEVRPIVILPKTGNFDKQKALEYLGVRGDRNNVGVIERADSIVIGIGYSNERLAAFKSSDRPDLWRALGERSNADIRIAFSPSPDHHRVLSEAVTSLPEPFDDVSGQELSDMVQGGRIDLVLHGNFSVIAVVQAKDELAAAKGVKTWNRLIEMTKEIEVFANKIPKEADLEKLLPCKAEGDKVVLELKPSDDLQKLLVGSLVEPVAVAKEAAFRSSSANNIKQIALAVHNFYSVYEKLPQNGTVGDDGKAKLSWRVHILPFLDQVELYNQFHLDEPWDSEHNKKLIEKMPKNFEHPKATGIEIGKTVYLSPSGEHAVFGKAKKVNFSDITDGTSNTVMIVEVAPEKAVIWTAPEDYESTEETAGDGLFVWNGKGSNVGFADGSVRFITSTFSKKNWWRILIRDDGEVVENE